MKRKKLKLMTIGNQVLTRSDMKNIMAGSGGGGSGEYNHVRCCDSNGGNCSCCWQYVYGCEYYSGCDDDQICENATLSECDSMC